MAQRPRASEEDQMGELYVPVAIESIQPNHFPDVALYLRSGSNYVLYKSHGRNFNSNDRERLLQNLSLIHI
jgi:hypothetical protein